MSAPSQLDREAFVAAYGHVFEHSPWIAQSAWDTGLPADADTAAGLHRALCAALAPASDERKLALIQAHPDLAGKLAQAGRLTAESTQEQASAGLDRLTDEERANLHRAQRRLPRPLRLSLHHRRQGPEQERYPGRVRATR